jgi:hypothetical protein
MRTTLGLHPLFTENSMSSSFIELACTRTDLTFRLSDSVKVRLWPTRIDLNSGLLTVSCIF